VERHLRNLLALVGLLLSAPAFVTVTGAAGPSPDWLDPLGYRSSEAQAISLNRFGYPMVPVRLQGTALVLPLDTGNMARFSISRQVAGRLRLKTVDSSRTYDSSGQPLRTVAVYSVESLDVLGRHWERVRATEVNVPDVEGLVGPQFLADARLTLDYPRRLLAINRRGQRPALPDDALPLLESPLFPGMPVIRGRIQGRNVLVQIDTGKSRTCVDHRLVEELGLKLAPRGYRLDGLEIAGLRVDVPSAREDSFVGISQGYPGPIMVGIGADVLASLEFTIDYRDRRILLRRGK
jgi:hypothetical protein